MKVDRGAALSFSKKHLHGKVERDGVAEVTYQVGDKRITVELYVTREKCVPILGLEVSVALGLMQPDDTLVTSQGDGVQQTDSQPEHNMEMRIHSVYKYFQLRHRSFKH